MDHATWPARIVLGLFSVIIVATILLAQRGRKLFVRRIPGLTAIDEAVGRATEMGRPLLMSVGLGSLDATTGIITLQALAIITSIVQTAARYGNRILLPVYNPALLPIIEDAVRDAYAAAGRENDYSPDDIAFLSNRQFAYAAGVAGLINREQVASLFLFGTFYAESLIIAENGNRVGAIQVAGTPSTTQIPFFIAACDYVIIGDEFYAATAFLTRQPTLLGSLVGQDIAKGLLLGMVLIGVILTSLGIPLLFNFFGDRPQSLTEMLRGAITAGAGGDKNVFAPQQGITLYLYIAGALAFSGAVLVLLQALPPRARRPLIIAITFVAGLFYALEFFWPVGQNGTNFLTPYITPAAQVQQVLTAFALGVGVYSLLSVHLRSVARQRAGWGFSGVLIVALIVMATAGLLSASSAPAKGVYQFLFDGGLKALDATMFSIVAFYIVSAAYRAFRVRSLEATILLASAALVMLGQVALGQALTGGLPASGPLANLRTENIAGWILTRVSSPALLAVEFGLGIGSLATALRVWLSLERGSYFEKEL